MSANFMISGATVQKLWMFEVFGQGLTRAGMCWSQPARVDHLHKKWRAREKKFKKKELSAPYPGITPEPAGNQQSPASRGSTPGQGQTIPFFKYFYIFLNVFFWKFREWARAFGRMGVQHPHFLKLGSVKSCKLHGDWRFHFFSNFIFSKFILNLDIHIYRSDFCSIKNLDH
jgi:hypothetical protein